MKFFWLFFLVLSINLQAQEAIEGSIKPDFFHFINGKKIYNQESKVVHVNIQKSDLENGEYMISGNNDVSFFLNNYLWIKGRTININSSLYDSLTVNKVLLSIYKSSSDTKLEIKFLPRLNETKNEKQAMVRTGLGYGNFISILFLLLLALFMTLKLILKKELNELFDLGSIISSKNKDERIFRNKLRNQNSLTVLIFFSLVTGFVLIELIHSSLLMNKWGELLFLWVSYSSSVFMFLLGKAVLINIFGFIFNMTKTFPVHFYNYLRTTLILIIFTAIIIFIYAWEFPNISSRNLVFSILIVGGLIRTALLFTKLNSEVRYKVFHLFSYLCATELLPFFGLWFISRNFIEI